MSGCGSLLDLNRPLTTNPNERLTKRMKYPLAPLIQIAQTRSRERYGYTNNATVASLLGVKRETVSKWDAKNTVSIGLLMADRCATTLGLHIDIIWAEPEVTELFLNGQVTC